MSSHKLATRYAKSLILLAQENGKLDEVFSDIKSLDQIFKTNRDLILMFRSPIVTPDKKQNVIKALFEGKISDILFRFITLMINKGREGKFYEIVQAYIVQYNLIKGITPVTITSAVKLDATQVQNIINGLKRNENLKEVELHEVIDTEMIGGFILTYSDKMIDNSVATSLNTIKAVIEDDTYIKKYS